MYDKERPALARMSIYMTRAADTRYIKCPFFVMYDKSGEHSSLYKTKCIQIINMYDDKSGGHSL